MNTLCTFFLTGSIALTVSITNTYAQNAADNLNNSSAGQAPTIEDRLAQLEQDQQGLTGRVNTLNREVTSLQQEIKTLEGQSSQSNGRSSKAAAGATTEMPGTTGEVSADQTNGTSGASYDLFYDRLQSDGQWFNDATYGSVWQPQVASTDQQWRPYTDGRWVYTDRGWTWISNENFGWATYHYGRWARLSERGWVWVPGSTWAPAWVSWRQSDDYVGWAPLPPETESEQDVKIEGWADTYYNIGPGSYVFLRTTDLANPSYRRFIASSHDDLDIISGTKNVTNIYYGKIGVIENGPDYDRLVRDANVKIDRYQLNYVQQNNPEAQFGATARGNQLEVVAPAPRLQRAATIGPKIAGDIANAQVDRGWQDIDETKAKQLKQTWEKQAPVPASLPAKPAPPKPLFARNQRQELKQGDRQESTPPAPSPSLTPNEKAAEQQPPNANQNRRQEPNQAERPETTPPAPSPSENERSIRQPDRRETPPKENRRQEQGEGDRAQPTPSRAESPRPKGEKTTRQPKNGEETPSRSEGPQREEDRRKSNVEESERPASGEQKSRSRDQSGSENPGTKKRPDEPEKKKVGPPEQE